MIAMRERQKMGCLDVYVCLDVWIGCMLGCVEHSWAFVFLGGEYWS